MTQQRICPAGHENDVDARYCQECGATLEHPGPPATTPPAPAQAAWSEAQAQAKEGSSPEDAAAESGQVSSGPGPTRSRKALLRAGAVVALLLLVVGVAAGAFFLLQRTEVPDLVGMTASQAEKALTDVGLEPRQGPSEFSEATAKGQIARQDPPAGDTVSGGSQVTLHVSRGPASTTPDMVGLSLTAARAAAKEVDLTIEETREISETVAAGEVMSQNPPPGAQLEAGDTVSVLVSSGPPTTTVMYRTDISGSMPSGVYCSTWASLWTTVYRNLSIANGADKVIARNSGLSEASGNGYFFPCYVEATFANVPTTEEQYQFWFNPDEHEDNHGGTYSRSQMELAGWRVTE